MYKRGTPCQGGWGSLGRDTRCAPGGLATLARMPGDAAGGLGTLPEDWPRDTFCQPTDEGKGSAFKHHKRKLLAAKAKRLLTSTPEAS